MEINRRRRTPLTVITTVQSSAEWKEAAGAAADNEDIPLSEWIVRAVAAQLKRPELAVIPRKKMGRPRLSQVGQKPIKLLKATAGAK